MVIEETTKEIRRYLLKLLKHLLRSGLGRPLHCVQIGAEQTIETTDLLVIDVEGHEKQVLAGTDLATLRPKLAIVECNERQNRQATAAPFLAAGYQVFRIGQETVALSPDFPALPDAGGLLALSGLPRMRG